MSMPMFDLSKMLKDVPGSFSSMESAAGPAAAAMMAPLTIAMTGWVVMCGVGLGVVQALMPSAMTDDAPQVGGGNVVPLKIGETKTEAATRKTPALALVKASAPVAVSRTTTPKAAAVKAAVVKPAVAKPAVAAPVAARPIAEVTKALADEAVKRVAAETAAAKVGAKVAAPASRPAAAKVAVAVPAAKKAEPVARIATKTSAKGISLPKVSIEDDKPIASAPDADKPKGMAAARAGGPDDLKMVSGIGPKIEAVLNGLGVYHFDQIAAWTPKEVAWVDQYLRFNGRIVRDGWIAQADALAAGGRAEYAKRFGKDPR